MKALVIGGTGAIGSAVVRTLGKKRVATTFTYRTNRTTAESLAKEVDARAVSLDLTDLAAVRSFDLSGVSSLIFCAASPAIETDEEIARALTVIIHAPLVMCRALAGPANIVFVGALHGGQSLPLAAPFAASQGALGPLAMALAKELGPRNVRVNLVTGGLTKEGVAASIPRENVEAFERFSALRRLGTPDEIAAPIVWLALENTYVSGKVLQANGGI